MNAQLSTTCAIQLRKANVSRTNLAENRHASCTKHASILHKTKHKSEQDRGNSLTANRTQGVLLLRSPSATTTGHPLRVYARLPAENKSFKPLRSTSVDVVDSKRLSNNAMTPKKPLLPSKELSSHITARLTSTESQAVTGAAVAAGATVSQWLRQAALDSLVCPPWARLLLGEFLALRSVVVDLQRDLMQGVKPSTERMKAILDIAETRKFAQADGRLATLRAAKETVAK